MKKKSKSVSVPYTGSISFTGSSTSGQCLTTTGAGYYNWSTSGYVSSSPTEIREYTILGAKVSVNPFEVGSENLSLKISLINTMGIGFYAELKNQGEKFPESIEKFLNTELHSYERDKKIEEIIK